MTIIAVLSADDRVKHYQTGYISIDRLCRCDSGEVTDGVAEWPEIIPDEPEAVNTDVGILFINEYNMPDAVRHFSFQPPRKLSEGL